VKNFPVGDLVPPADAKDTFQATHVEWVWDPYMATVWSLRFTAVQEDGNTHSFVDCQLGWHCKVPVMEYAVRETTKSNWSKFSMFLDFTGQVAIVGQYGAKIVNSWISITAHSVVQMKEVRWGEVRWDKCYNSHLQHICKSWASAYRCLFLWYDEKDLHSIPHVHNNLKKYPDYLRRMLKQVLIM